MRTVESILGNGYDDLELVVVDDGSRDATLDVLRRNFGARREVRILTQPNGGKSAALNNAIAHARHDILIALDADTIFRAGTIGKLVRHFADSRGGCGLRQCARGQPAAAGSRASSRSSTFTASTWIAGRSTC